MPAERRAAGLMVVLVALARRPSLWRTAFSQLRLLVPRGWMRRAPFLPVPDADYLRFRMVTAHGGSGSSAFEADEVMTYLEWCRAWPYVAGSN